MSRGAIAISGLIDPDVAALFGESLAALTPSDRPIEIDLGRARVDDERIAEIVADAIRQTVTRLGDVRVVHAPSAIRRRLEPR